MVEALRDYISYGAEIVDHAGVFFQDEIDFENEDAHEILRDADVPPVMTGARRNSAGVGDRRCPCHKSLAEKHYERIEAGR